MAQHLAATPAVTVNDDHVEIGRFELRHPSAVSLLRSAADPSQTFLEMVQTGCRALAVAHDNGALAAAEDQLRRLERGVDRLGDTWSERITAGVQGATEQLAASFETGPQALLSRFVDDLKELLDPDTPAGHAHALVARMQQQLSETVRHQLEATGATIRSQLNLTDPEGPIGLLRRDVSGLQDVLTQVHLLVGADQARRAEADVGTRKGLTFEQLCEVQLGAAILGDGVVEDVSRKPGVNGRKQGDFAWHLPTAAGNEATIAVEAKTGKQVWTREAARKTLAATMANRDATGAVLLVASSEQIPGKQPLLLLPEDRMAIVAVEADTTMALRVALQSVRAFVLRHQTHQHATRSNVDIVGALDLLEAAQRELRTCAQIRGALTRASSGTDDARQLLDRLAAEIEDLLRRTNDLLAPTVSSTPAAA